MEVLTVDAGRVAVAAESVQVDGLVVLVAEATQLPAQEAASERGVHVEPIVLHLTERIVEVLGQVQTSPTHDLVAGSDGSRDEGRVEPGGRLVGAEEDGSVENSSELLHDQGTNLAPDVEPRVSEDVLVNRNDDGDLFRDEVLVDPAHLGGGLATLDDGSCGGVVHADESGSG